LYRLDPASVSIGDLTQARGDDLLVTRRGTGSGRELKRIYQVTLDQVGGDGTLLKRLSTDLMNIDDPAGKASASC
jgi:hypothetical protein